MRTYVCVCVCVCVWSAKNLYHEYIMIIFEVLMSALSFLDLLKRSVLTLVGEIWRYKNDRCYYYYYYYYT